MPTPSRRTVLATGSALGGAALVGTLPARATAATGAGRRPERLDDLHAETDAWRGVLDDADLVWQKMPTTWYEGPYLGNGRLGSGIYQEPGTNAVRFNVQHSEVQDHRPEFGSLFGLARLPIGHFTLEPVGTITGLDWRLRLRLRDAARHGVPVVGRRHPGLPGTARRVGGADRARVPHPGRLPAERGPREGRHALGAPGQ
ncbi:hypothetical protein [Streptomyces sp. NPDC050264]|uniref:hypothetical protein n=1 Tax=Streptomyces sp. NPDC050264 TaxID=3155038 RepID=UPI00341D7229